MPKKDDDAQMRAQLALMELEQVEVDDQGNVKDKPYEAYRMRVAGVPNKQIAKRLGYPTEQAVSRAIMVYRQETAAMLDKAKRLDWLDLQVTRIETLMHPYWTPALLGDTDAATFCLRSIIELNKLLGLYEGESTTVSTKLVLVQQERGQYIDQLKEIALKSESKVIEGGS
jgi:hypothetical protein